MDPLAAAAMLGADVHRKAKRRRRAAQAAKVGLVPRKLTHEVSAWNDLNCKMKLFASPSVWAMLNVEQRRSA